MGLFETQPFNKQQFKKVEAFKKQFKKVGAFKKQFKEVGEIVKKEDVKKEDEKRLMNFEVDLNNPDHIHVSVEGPNDPENWEQEEDVLDTWASSWLWPFATLGWPNSKEDLKFLKRAY